MQHVVVRCALFVLVQPVYGVIQAKLELITHAYFEGRDFSQVRLLEDTYKTLNMSLNESLLNNSQVFVGLCFKTFIALSIKSICLLTVVFCVSFLSSSLYCPWTVQLCCWFAASEASVCVAAVKLFKLLLLLKFYSDSHETWHT